MTPRPINFIKTVSWIKKNLLVCSHGHMTPEIRLQLLTPECPLWMCQPDQCPYPDPYWAFYWPGGQALTRYIFDHPETVKGKIVLDFGSGCGASAIAATLCGAKKVVANDIDPVALLASAMNAKLNGLKLHDIHYEMNDLLKNEVKTKNKFDLILVGDMCYDSEFSSIILKWLKEHKMAGAQVIIGDPGRHCLSIAQNIVILNTLAYYPLPDHMAKEHYGLSCANIFSIT